MMNRTAYKPVTLMIAVAIVIGLASGCSREQRDWRSAQSADSMEAYDRFLELHPESTLATQARMRLTQLTEERDWQRASTTDTSDSYRQFLTQHPNGKWSQEARIRGENFSLEDQALSQSTDQTPPTPRSSSAAQAHADPSEFATSDDETHAQRATSLEELPRTADEGQAARGPPATDTNDDAALARPVTPVSAGEDVMPARPAMPASASDESTPATSMSERDLPAPGRTASSTESGDEMPRATAAEDSSFGIQLGAFSSESKADEEWRRLESRFTAELSSLQPHVIPASTSSGQLYRLQATVESEERARGICASLLEKSQGCVVVLPQR